MVPDSDEDDDESQDDENVTALATPSNDVRNTEVDVIHDSSIEDGKALYRTGVEETKKLEKELENPARFSSDDGVENNARLGKETFSNVQVIIHVSKCVENDRDTSKPSWVDMQAKVSITDTIDTSNRHGEVNLSPPRKSQSTRQDDDYERDVASNDTPKAVFRDPMDLWGSEDELQVATPIAREPSYKNAAGEEVSQSYIRLTTSPMSSVLSSPPASRPPSISPSKGLRSRGNSPSTNLNEARETTVVTDLNSQEHAAPRLRVFRHRNAIQLHPYLIEDKRYRRELHSHGIAPVRVVHTPEPSIHHRRIRKSTSPQPESPRPDSKRADSQNLSETAQPMDLDSDSASPSPVVNPIGAESGCSSRAESSSEDEEFPDLEHLLRQARTAPRRPEPKRPIKSYSKKFRRQQTSAQDRSANGDMGNRLENEGPSVWDVPVSPPATSSSLPASEAGYRKTASRNISVSSRDPTPSWMFDDDPAIKIPTPATSAVKPMPEVPEKVIVINDDPFASSPSIPLLSSSSDESSADEAIQIRKVGKKIRGVLPASHVRLDQRLKKPIPMVRDSSDSRTASPVPQPARRGVALPRTLSTGITHPSSTTNGIFPDMSEDSEDDASVMFMSEKTGLTSPFAQDRRGDAIEEDRIDAMLPSKKRARGLDLAPRKKIRAGSSTFRMPSGTRSHQPRITEHLTKGGHQKCHKNQGKHASKRRNKDSKSHYDAPKLSILDVMDSDYDALPQFIKIAARTARTRKGQGRQSPSKKFIRLATREDTIDAQSVLQDWKDGKFKPRDLTGHRRRDMTLSRMPLGQLANNGQTMLHSPIQKVNSQFQDPHARNVQLGVRRLTISKNKQSSMADFITEKASAATHRESLPYMSRERKHTMIPQGRPTDMQLMRPAQLESSEIEMSRTNPTYAFKNKIKSFDSLYRNMRRAQAPQVNLPLTRFLADDDILPSVEDRSSMHGQKTDKTTISAIRAKKGTPRRLDIGAAIYRQPSEPMILELVIEPQKETSGDKLCGLGKFGTRYSIHFDIFPLQTGICFNRNTFIGSGRLAKLLAGQFQPASHSVPYIKFRLGTKDLQWGAWQGTISSEVGLCFDSMLDQLFSQDTVIDLSSHNEPDQTIAYMIEYVQNYASFTGPKDRGEFLSRFFSVVQEFIVQFDKKCGTAHPSNTKDKIQSLSSCLVLVYHLLQVCHGQAELSSLSFQFEGLLVDISRCCVKFLLGQGLDSVRKLYDNLQYFSFREQGIQSSEYVPLAWLLVLRILKAARIPRSSFWDVVNTQLLSTDINTISDAPALERLWHSIFSLLPLCEFDDFGVIVQGSRDGAGFDNWALPQKILKRIFSLCSLNPRQTPGFNDYCRALVSRCHFLVSEWGWWNCSGIIGTIFDFFASQRLAHLRNEEVQKSPHFLEELEGEPNLAVVPEDRCFHIFLKIIALAIKHMNKSNNLKGIRNLVARLLPNHDRQLLKEDVVLERDLAALRNHHDLLCTLFWATPPEYRPALDLLQELVVADRSHNAACTINLRAWKQLARYVLSSSQPPGFFKPFATWQDIFFGKVLDQYVQEAANTQAQAQSYQAPGLGAISDTRLQEQISANRTSTITTLRQVLGTVLWGVEYSRDFSALQDTLNTGKFATTVKALC